MVTMTTNLQTTPPGMEIAPEVEIRPSDVDTERLGIWCKQKIEAGSKFGPFLGERVLEGTDDMDPSFVWEIVDLESKEFLCYINATEPTSGNWMRYINCARYFEEQNIVSEQEGIDIFYRAIKDIEPGEELLTWYERAPFRKKKGGKRIKKAKVEKPSAKTSRSNSPESRASVSAEIPESLSPTFQEDDMHTSQRGRRRKVTKYWEMENLENSENSDFQRESDINSEDDMTIASDDDWNTPNLSKLDESQVQGEQTEENSSEYFQFEVRPYHIVKSWLGRKVFKCEICSGVYRHSFSLKRHFIRNHINYAFVSKTDLLNCNVSYSRDGEVSLPSTPTEEKDKVEFDDVASRNGQDDEECNTPSEKPESAPKEVEANEKSQCGSKDEDGDGLEEEKDGNISPTSSCSSAIESLSRNTSSSSVPLEEDLMDPETSSQPEKNSQDTNDKESEASGKNLMKPEAAGPSLTGIKMTGLYRCNVCEKLFDTVYDLKEHLSNHPESSSKAFACDKCDMKFTHKQNLMRHTAVHTGARPFICKYCGKKFPTITNQKRHERIHQGRRFSCDHCSSTFSQTGDLKKHVRKLHPELFHECGFCAKYYASTALLKEHLKESHGEDIDANTKEISFRKEAFKVDLESDRAESMRLAIQRGLSQSKPQYKFACTVCKKKFPDYANMCRHRRLAHQRHMMHLGTMKKDNSEMNHAHSPLRALFDPDMDRNSAFYARVSKNIADNLKYHVEGKQDEIKQGNSFIKWKNMEQELVMPVDKKVDKLEQYNFPQGYVLKETLKLLQEKVSMKEYVESSGLGAIEKSQAIILDLPEENPSESEQKSPDAAMHSDTNMDSRSTHSGGVSIQPRPGGMLSPPALSRCPDFPSSPHPPSPVNKTIPNPPKTLTIKVPEMKLCKICHCVFHNRDVFRDHMMHKHRIVIPPPQLEPQAPTSPTAPLNSPPAHQHQRPMHVVPPPLPPGVNPNLARSLIVSPHLSPPPAHQGPAKQLSPAPPKLSPMMPSVMASPTLLRPADLAGPPHPPSPTIPTPSPSEASGAPPDIINSASQQAETKPKSANEHNKPPADTKGKKQVDIKEDPSKQVTGDDPNPKPRKFVCLVCFNEFKDQESLTTHQEDKHKTVQCKSVAVDLSFTRTWLTQPSPVGMLNVSTSQLPTKDATATPQKVVCTKCRRMFASSGDLHTHILDCGDYGRNAPPLAYIWYLRGQVITPSKKNKKTGHGKFRRGRNLPTHKKKSSENQQKGNELSREEQQLLAQRRILERQMSQESPEEEPGEFSGRRRRRRIHELSYNPHNHVRRRDLAELLGNKCLGCGETFDIISMLERHIPMCPDKEKIRGNHPVLTKPPPIEAADSDNDFDPNKHMCIYCEKQFTYLGMLRKHILDVCTVRKDLVEKEEYIDEEWELDIDIKTGHATGRSTLSRQSSMSSLNGILGEEGENSQDSFDRPRRRRKRRGHNWGYKPKGASKRRPEDEITPYMLEESFFADNDSSNSRVASVGEDESSNDSTAMALGTTAADMANHMTDVNSQVKTEQSNGKVTKPNSETKPKEETAEKTENTDNANENNENKISPKEEGKKKGSKKAQITGKGTNKVKKDVGAVSDTASQEIKDKLAKKIKEGKKKSKPKSTSESKGSSPSKKVSSALGEGKGSKPKADKTEKGKKQEDQAKTNINKVSVKVDTESEHTETKSGVPKEKSKNSSKVKQGNKSAQKTVMEKSQDTQNEPILATKVTEAQAQKPTPGQKAKKKAERSSDTASKTSEQKSSLKAKTEKVLKKSVADNSAAESSDEEDDIKLSDLKGSFGADNSEKTDKTALDKTEEQEDEMEEEEEEEEVEESAPKKRRRRGPRLTMKKRKSWGTGNVARLTYPEPEEESVRTTTMEEEEEDTSPERERSPSTRQQSKVPEANKRDTSPASKPGTRESSPIGKGQNKRKRKSNEIEHGNEEGDLMENEQAGGGSVSSGRGKKAQKTFHTRSKSASGVDVNSKVSEVPNVGKGRGGRKSDPSLSMGIQLKVSGRGAGARKSMG